MCSKNTTKKNLLFTDGNGIAINVDKTKRQKQNRNLQNNQKINK